MTHTAKDIKNAIENSNVVLVTRTAATLKSLEREARLRGMDHLATEIENLDMIVEILGKDGDDIDFDKVDAALSECEERISAAPDANPADVPRQILEIGGAKILAAALKRVNEVADKLIEAEMTT